MSIPPNRNKLRRAVVGSAPVAAWWTADPDGCDEASGVVTQMRDLVTGRVLTFPVGHRPVRTAGRLPYVTFNLAEGGKDTGGLLNGCASASLVLVWRDGNYTGNYAFLVYYGDDGGSASQAGRMVVYTYAGAGRLASYTESPAGTANEMLTNAALDTSWHVNVHRLDLSRGTTAEKFLRQDGADVVASAYSAAGAVSGTLGSKPFMLGTADTAFASGYTFPAKGDLADAIPMTAEVSDAVADLVQQCLKALRGTP